MTENESELLSLAEVQKFLGIGRTKIYELREDPTFPPPYYLSLKNPRWFKHELMDWLRSKPRHAPAPAGAHQ